MDNNDRSALARWRLILGKTAQDYQISVCQAHEQQAQGVIDFLFDESKQTQGRKGKGRQRQGGKRSAGLGGGHPLTIPAWVELVNELFPQQVKEVLQRELVKRRGITELLEQPELLEKVEPSQELVKTLLTHKDLLNPKTRILARKIIDKVVQEIKDKIKVQVEQSIVGAIRRDRHSPRKCYRNLDLKRTLHKNLLNWDEQRSQLLVEKVYFYAAERRKRPWHIIIAVDQSGSMLDSAIFCAVMASIFYELPAVRTSLYLFDTEVADLSDQVGQPVDVLLRVQLGGGTNIAKAVAYGQQLVREPKRTIFILISDFYEGGSVLNLRKRVNDLSDSGVKMIGLGALGYDARPDYCEHTAKMLRKSGMDILVCTPEKLAQCISHIIRC